MVVVVVGLNWQDREREEGEGRARTDSQTMLVVRRSRAPAPFSISTPPSYRLRSSLHTSLARMYIDFSALEFHGCCLTSWLKGGSPSTEFQHFPFHPSLAGRRGGRLGVSRRLFDQLVDLPAPYIGSNGGRREKIRG